MTPHGIRAGALTQADVSAPRLAVVQEGMSTKAALRECETINAHASKIAGPETKERLRAASNALRHWRIEALVRVGQRQQQSKRGR